MISMEIIQIYLLIGILFDASLLFIIKDNPNIERKLFRKKKKGEALLLFLTIWILWLPYSLAIITLRNVIGDSE